MAYSGDIVQLQADNPHLEFVYPDEGAMLFTDNMMIPAKAAHPYAAETMMNYVYEPAGGGEDRGLRELHLAGQGRRRRSSQKTDPKLAQQPADLPVRRRSASKLHPYPALSPADERAMEERMAQVTGA